MSRVATTGVGDAAGIEHRHDRFADAERRQGLLEVVEARSWGTSGRWRGARRRRPACAPGARAGPGCRAGRARRSARPWASGSRSTRRRPWTGSAVPPAAPGRETPSTHRRTAGAPRRRRNASLGLGRSPASGRLWYSSASIHIMNVDQSSGLSCTSDSSRQVTMPRPSDVSCIMSLTSNSGSPKNWSAPCDSSSTIFRSSTPTVAPGHARRTAPAPACPRPSSGTGARRGDRAGRAAGAGCRRST